MTSLNYFMALIMCLEIVTPCNCDKNFAFVNNLKVLLDQFKIQTVNVIIQSSDQAMQINSLVRKCDVSIKYFPQPSDDQLGSWLFLPKDSGNMVNVRPFLATNHSNIFQKDVHLIFGNPSDLSEFRTWPLTIDMQVYFVSFSDYKVFEHYVINGVKVQNFLGQVKSQSYVPNPNLSQSFMLRRSDFHGATLKAMVDYEGPSLRIQKDFRETAPYFESNQTYDVTKVTSGIFHEILMAIEQQLNFSARLYRREDGGWGGATLLENGTVVSTGIFRQ